MLLSVYIIYYHRHCSSRIELQLQDMSTDVAQVQSSTVRSMDLLNLTTEAVCRQELLLAGIQQGMHRSVETDSPSELARPTETLGTSPLRDGTSGISHLSESASQSQMLTLRLTEGPCYKLRCGCSCHQRRRLQSPSLLDRLLGSLFVGYVGFPRLLSRCEASSCCVSSTTQIYVSYVFPGWLLKFSLLTKIKLSMMEGPELLIRCLHIRHFGTTSSFKAIAQTRFDHLRNLIMTREASVLDVDDFGVSLLQVSTSHVLYSSQC